MKLIRIIIAACVGASLTSAEFSWDSIEPTDDLQWRDCFDSFTCTRLKVPLNYSEPTGETAAIALIRDVSPLGTDSNDYRGPILFNPGGPGAPGTEMVLQNAPLLRELVGPMFDLIGFDPRGVGSSTPTAFFFDSQAERLMWKEGPIDIPVAGRTEDEVKLSWARYSVSNGLLKKSGKEYLKHITTDHTARDMLQITEKYGFEKLQYMGYSYGSVLGATFASMFPDKIERMIIDGVEDADNYYATLWDNNLIDTEKAMQMFYDSCHAAGPEACAFWFDSPEAIQKALDDIYASVIESPVPVISEKGYGTLDYKRLRGTIFNSLYAPFSLWPVLAQGLADLRNKNDASVLFDIVQGEKVDLTTGKYDSAEGLFAVACNDGHPLDPSLDAFLSFSTDFRKTTPWADAWDSTHLGCVNYPSWPNNHFQGPVGAPSTSFPLLVIGNTADPVTSLWAANKATGLFPGSVLLTQDSAGHSSLTSPSTCTSSVVQSYMVNGTLPEEGTICPIDGTPFAPAAPARRAQTNQTMLHNPREGPRRPFYRGPQRY